MGRRAIFTVPSRFKSVPVKTRKMARRYAIALQHCSDTNNCERTQSSSISRSSSSSRQQSHPPDSLLCTPHLSMCIPNRNLNFNFNHGSIPMDTTQPCVSLSPSISSIEGKTVHFADPEATVNITPYQEVEDIQNSWYRSNDYISFEQDTQLTVLALQNAHGDLRCFDPQEYTITGLEKRLTRRQSLQRKLQTARHVHTVLALQHMSVMDEHMLRAYSELLSKQTIQRAHIRGVLDQTLLGH